MDLSLQPLAMIVTQTSLETSTFGKKPIQQYTELTIDYFGLFWLTPSPDKSDNIAISSITINHIIDTKQLQQAFLSLYQTYPYLQSRIVQKSENGKIQYLLQIPKDFDESSPLPVFETDLDNRLLFEKLNTTQLNLFTPVMINWWYRIDPASETTEITTVSSHAFGDGSTIKFFVQALIRLYFGARKTMLPKIQPMYLLPYCKQLTHTKYSQPLGITIGRYLKGMFYFLKKKILPVKHQVFNPKDKKELLQGQKVFTEFYQFPVELDELITHFKKQQCSSNDVLISLITYAYLTYFGYKSTVVTYPADIRKIGGSDPYIVGNILLANTVKLRVRNSFEKFLLQSSRKMKREKFNTGPYNAALLAKFLKYSIRGVEKQMNNNFTTANLRISNTGKGEISPVHDTSSIIPHISDSIASAYPLSGGLVNMFLTATPQNYRLQINYVDLVGHQVSSLLDSLSLLVRQLYQEFITQSVL